MGAWLLAFLVWYTGASPQSTYNIQETSAEYEEGGLQEFGTLNGTVTELGKKLYITLSKKKMFPKDFVSSKDFFVKMCFFV